MHFNLSTSSGSGLAGKMVFSLFGLAFAFTGTLFVKQEWGALQGTKAMQEWAKTPCTILSSEVEDAGEDFRLAISYRYEVDGRSYTGERYGQQQYHVAESIVDIERIHKQLPAGKTVEGYYNPDNPFEAVLDLPTVKGARRAIGFTLIFPAVGILFASLPWLRWRKPKSIKKETGQRSPQVALIVFGLVFTSIGLSLIKPILINPLQKTRAAQRWETVPATVVSSKVKSHSDDDGTTYSVYIAYRYEINGTEYVGDRYTFTGGSSNGHSGKAEIVRQYPRGSEFTLYVDPANPAESVIKRDYSPALLFGLVPLVFAIVGLGVLVSGFRNKKPRLDMTQAREHVIMLKGPSRIGKVAGLLIFTVFWNGVVYFLSISDASLVLPLAFGFFGLILIGATINAFLSLFNPQPTVEITPGDIHPGTRVAMRWRTSGRTDRIGTLSIRLKCLKITTTTTGSGKNRSTRIIKTPLLEQELLQTSSQAEIAQGTAQFDIPPGQPASRPGNHNGIQWQIVFHGDIARWPDMKEERMFVVYPNDAETRLTD